MQVPGFTAELVLWDRVRSRYVGAGRPGSAQEEITPQLYIATHWDPDDDGGGSGGGDPFGYCPPHCSRDLAGNCRCLR